MLLALGYRCRQGKDTCGAAIVAHLTKKREMYIKHGLGSNLACPAKIFKFSTGVYEVCQKQYGMVTKDPSLLQQVGQSRREEFGEDYWIKQLAEAVSKFPGHAIITDLRFLNEAAWIKKQGGFVINVTRLNADGTPFVSDDRDPNHISEIQLDNYKDWDGFIKTRAGEEVLAAELAITIAEYFLALKEN